MPLRTSTRRGVSVAVMTVPSSRTADRRDTAVAAGPRRAFAILVGLTVLFVFLQSLTAGEFISDGLPERAKEVWTDAHGLIAYPIMVFALAAAVVGALRLREARGAVVGAAALFVLAVVQWLLGHCITTLGWDWVTPWHVVLAFVVYGLSIWLSVRSAALRRGR
jgi:heme A synthase